MTSPVVLCVRRTDAFTHTGAASAILAILVCMTCHWWTRGASISQDLGWPHFLLQQGAWRIYWGHIPIVPPGKKEQIPITARSNAGSQCAWYVLGYFTGFSWIGALPRAAWWHPDCTRRPKWVAGACHPNCLGSQFRWWDLRPFRKEYRCPWAVNSRWDKIVWNEPSIGECSVQESMAWLYKILIQYGLFL
jgi:hypothetical protein